MIESDGTSRTAELEADNRRLRRLLEQRDAPGELRHRLQNTLAMLRVVIRKSARSGRDLGSYVGHLEDRLEAIARAQAAADERGAVDLHGVLADELLHYGAKEGERVALSGPSVCLLPRAGQVMALAVHELVVNAVEHGALGAPDGKVDVEWRIEAGALLSIAWKESGSTGSVEPRRQGFGTEVLNRTLGYELKAATTIAFEPDGLRCTLRIPLTDRIGHVGDD